MADRTKYAVSATVIEDLTDENGGSHLVVHSDINKTLGGGNTITASGAVTYDYVSAAPAGATFMEDETAYSFVFIKHSGYTTSDLDVATEATVYVRLDSQTLCVLNPGDAMVLPNVNVSNPYDIAVVASSGTVAVERVLVV